MYTLWLIGNDCIECCDWLAMLSVSKRDKLDPSYHVFSQADL